MSEITHGNFFSGSGTWELAFKLCGVDTLWESEIEPFPVALEAKRFPEAKQLGDISKVSGYDIEPVDIMTNSSPCQDLSVAGKRQGMTADSGTRSSLFHEVIRITKEMREKDESEQLRVRGSVDHLRLRPRVWCWENVPGALSSNSGEDFRTVIEEVARIVEPEVSIPRPEKKWANAGSVVGNGWSIAWCIRNAANEGVPQRRRRIFLVASFGTDRASEILFKRDRLHWNFEEVRKAWEATSESLERRIDEAGKYIRGEISQPFGGECVEKHE
jgi:DNA (cytosine-5)-methyltransferase 1